MIKYLKLYVSEKKKKKKRKKPWDTKKYDKKKNYSFHSNIHEGKWFSQEKLKKEKWDFLKKKTQMKKKKSTISYSI